MASYPTSAISEHASPLTKGNIDPVSKHVMLTPGPSAFLQNSPVASTSSLGESDRENDDALVPSLPSAPPKPYWDDAFYNSTPTPKPPPRLAPMPKSPPSTARSPPPPLVISTQRSNNTPTTPILSPGDPIELISSKAKSKYASVFAAHNRSHSHNQAHSNHGNNIFAASSDSLESPNALGKSLSTMGTEGGLSAGQVSENRSPDKTAAKQAVRTYSSFSLFSHGSPAAVRSFFGRNDNARHSKTQSQNSPQLQRHNPSLTPSSSQSSLVSNLPSPMSRTRSTSNIFRDSSPASQSRLSSWVSSQSTDGPIDQGFSESSMMIQDTVASNTDGPTDEVANGSVNPMNGVSSSQRKIYPGLKNTIGPYKLIQKIGQGSFSEVKMAIDTRSGDHVAIKVMSRAMIQSSDRLGISVRRESDLLKSIQHPNIIGFREVVETPLQMCIVLDYAPGGELFDFVADKRSMASERDIQYIYAQIVDDVLLVPRQGAPLRPTVKLTDFGLAKVVEEGAPLLTTRCGSEDYASPEIILGQPYDGREADVWSLGVVLYALLVGFLPFNMRPGLGRKSFLSMIAHAEFGFPGEKVIYKRVSLHSLHQRSLSNASTGSWASTKSATPSNSEVPVSGSVGMLLPAATVETPLLSDDVTNSVVIPKMRGVESVSDESKDLVRCVLQTMGSRRPTAQQLWDHPWVALGRRLILESNATANSNAAV
ncbi:CBL-interacting serine/threonine-protein kinase 24 [Mortierella sp. AD010]|nr:CBL-interacting serine/threonine-protein kinase 24 [Mortierella sp. AD010]